MEALENLCNQALKLDENKLFNLLLSNKGFRDDILELNREGQLFDKGINSKGQTLSSIGGGYSPFTIKIKQAKGQPTDRVTLKDTGDFYESFYITLGEKEFYIDANPIKDDTNLFEEWGEDILGLTDESLGVLIGWVKNEIVPLIIDFLLGEDTGRTAVSAARSTAA